jgi:hypothetical protein
MNKQLSYLITDLTNIQARKIKMLFGGNQAMTEAENPF